MWEGYRGWQHRQSDCRSFWPRVWFSRTRGFARAPGQRPQTNQKEVYAARPQAAAAARTPLTQAVHRLAAGGDRVHHRRAQEAYLEGAAVQPSTRTKARLDCARHSQGTGVAARDSGCPQPQSLRLRTEVDGRFIGLPACLARSRWAWAFARLPHTAMLHQRRAWPRVRSMKMRVHVCPSHALM
jgi:hypothetical protein